MSPFGVVTAGAVAGWISGINQSEGRCGKYFGLFTRTETVHSQAVELIVVERRVYLPAGSVIYCQIRANLPAILRIGVALISASENQAASTLGIAGWNSQQEVRSRNSC